MSKLSVWSLPKVMALLTLISVTACPPTQADGGMIPVNSVKLFEPTQNALVAWNGEEEILLLSVDIHASAATNVLSVLPLPSEPKVSRGDFATFKKATEILNKHLPQSPVAQPSSGLSLGPMSIPGVTPGMVTFHKQLGAHDVTVMKVQDPHKFVAWSEKALRSLGSKNAAIPAWMQERIKSYLKDGINWFVFDSTQIGTGVQSKEPLRYRFATKRLFYPLKITSVSGESKPKLIVITSRPLRSLAPVKDAEVNTEPWSLRLVILGQQRTPASLEPIVFPSDFSITHDEISYIDQEIEELISAVRDSTNPRLAALEVRSNQKGSFSGDLFGYFDIKTTASGKVAAVSEVQRERVSCRKDGSFLLDGVPIEPPDSTIFWKNWLAWQHPSLQADYPLRLKDGSFLNIDSSGSWRSVQQPGGSLGREKVASIPSYDRFHAAATLMDDGRVAITGGESYVPKPHKVLKVEVYDPATQKVSVEGDILEPRQHHLATIMKDGRILLTGGVAGNQAKCVEVGEIFDPKTHLSKKVGKMCRPRSDHTAVALKDGRVMIIGGMGESFEGVRLIEYFNPATNCFEPGKELPFFVNNPLVIPLPDGDLLITEDLAEFYGYSRENGFRGSLWRVHLH